MGSRSLPKDYNEERFLDHMIRRDVLQHASGQMLACPIPSLRDYIKRMAQARRARDIGRSRLPFIAAGRLARSAAGLLWIAMKCRADALQC